MIRVEHSVVIQRPAKVVGDYLADIERQTEWTDMTASRRLSDGPSALGTRAYAEVAFGPLKLGWTWQYTTFDLERELAFETVSGGPLGMDGRYRLTPQGPDATQLDAIVEVKTRGLLRLLEPILRGEVTRNEAGELDRVKAILEGGAAASAG
jgi:uncharacterized membrane protein